MARVGQLHRRVLYILNGLFQAKVVFAIVAISGVAMVGLLRHPASTRGRWHNRKPRRLSPPREISLRDGVVPGAPGALQSLRPGRSNPQLILQPHRPDRADHDSRS